MTREDADALAERLNDTAPEGVSYEVAETEARSLLTSTTGGWFVRRVTD